MEPAGGIGAASAPVVAAPAPVQGNATGGPPSAKEARETQIYRPPGSDKVSQPEALNVRGGRGGGRGRGGMVRGAHGQALEQQQMRTPTPHTAEKPPREPKQPAKQHKAHPKGEQPPLPLQPQPKEPKPVRQPQQKPNHKQETGAAQGKVKLQKSGFDMQPAMNSIQAEKGQGSLALKEQGKGARGKSGGTSEAYAKFQADQAAQQERARKRREDEALARRLAAEQEAEAEAARKAALEEASAGPLVKLIKAQGASYWGQVACSLPRELKAGSVDCGAAAAISEASHVIRRSCHPCGGRRVASCAICL